MAQQKTINVILNTDPTSEDCAKVTVDTNGFEGKGCDAIHQMFANLGEVTSNVKKPEYKAIQRQQVVAR